MYKTMYAKKITAHNPVPADGKSECMASRRTAHKICWANESDDIKSKVLDAIEQQKKKMQEEMKALDQMSFKDMSPEDISTQVLSHSIYTACLTSKFSALQELHPILFNMCTDIFNMTGWTLVCIAGGPNPQNSNDIQLMMYVSNIQP